MHVGNKEGETKKYKQTHSKFTKNTCEEKIGYGVQSHAEFQTKYGGAFLT